MNTLTLKLTAVLILSLITYLVSAQTNWYAVSSGTTQDLLSVDFINAGTGIIVGNSGMVLKTTNAGQSWLPVSTGFTNTFHAVQYIDNEKVIIAGSGGLILYSTDGGNNWEVLQSGNQDYDIYDLAVDRVSGRGIAGGSGNSIIWSNDFGLTWTFVQGGYMNNFNCACMANDQFGAVAGVNAIFQPLIGFTNNGGQSFDAQPFYPTFNSTGYEGNSYACHFFDSNNGFIAGALWDGQGFVTREVNWGSQFWDALAFNHPVFGIDFINQSKGVVVGGDFGASTMIAETSDGGLSWQYANITGSGKTMRDVVLVDGTGYAVGLGGEILKREETIGYHQSHSKIVNINFHPNPVSDAGRLTVTLLNPAFVKIDIFNVYGQHLKNLHQGLLNEGTVTFDVETNNLLSGTYFMSVDDGNSKHNQKFIVLKKLQ